MLWNEPVWLNEILFNLTKLLVFTCMLVCIASVVLIINIIFYRVYTGGKPEDSNTPAYTKVILICFAVSCIGLMLFYLPQPVIPGSYSFDYITAELVSPHLKSEIVTIREKEALDQFRDIFDGYICRRSFLSDGSVVNYSYVAFIDLIVRDGNKSSPIHFIIRPGQLERYTAGNTDFIYTIEGHEDSLVDKVFDYVERYK